MVMDKVRVYFLGAGEIAVPVLAALTVNPHIELVGAGTQVDRPAGRNRRLTPTPVGEWAESNSYFIDKIESVNAGVFIDKLRSLRPQIILVISFGQLLKQEILHLDGAVCVNIHASLLPLYRGASPINAAILHRRDVTGITFMKMAEGLDTGDIFCAFDYPLDGTEDAESLETALGRLAAEKTPEVLCRIVQGELPAVPQQEAEATLTRKIRKEYGIIEWHNDADDIEAIIRAYHPWPGASFSLENAGKNLKLRVTAARIVKDMSGRPGEVLRADKKQWIIACGAGALEILKVVPEGKKEMGGADFLRGCRIVVGTVL